MFEYFEFYRIDTILKNISTIINLLKIHFGKY